MDDNELDLLTLQNFLSAQPEIELLGLYNNPETALPAIRKNKPDVVFLDIEMPKISGLELRKKILEVPVCIFATDHPEFAVDGFDLEALDYLIKPISEERFKKTISRINDYMSLLKSKTTMDSKQEKDTFYIKEGHQKVKIIIQEVLYLSALQNYTTLHTVQEKYYVLKGLSAQLKESAFEDFIRIHRSYAVHKNHIQSYSSKELILSNDEVLPIGRSYQNTLKAVL